MTRKPSSLRSVLPGAGLWLATLPLAAGCGVGPEADFSTTKEVPFDSLFRPTRATPLAADPEHVLGFPGGLAVRGNRWFIADPLQGDIKVVDAVAGRLTATIGRPGDGPGELRQPIGIESLPAGGIVVLDMGRSVLARFDTGGTFLGEAVLPGSWSGMAALDRADRILVVGAHATATGSGSADLGVLHEVETTGTFRSSYLPAPTPRDPFKASFNHYFAAAVGSAAVAGAFNTNVLTFHDRKSGREWKAAVGGPWYHAPTWPASDRDLPPGKTKLERVDKWARAQALLVGLVPVGDSLLLAQFRTGAEDGTWVYRYVLTDASGRVIVATGPTSAQIMRAVGDTTYGLTVRANGDAILDQRVLVAPPRSPAGR